MNALRFVPPIGTLLLLLATTTGIHAQGTAFTYQGRLMDNGSPANGSYDLQFLLFDDGSTGNPVGSTNRIAPVFVSNGLFSATLDFGSPAFDGNARWIQIAVRTNGSASPYVTLAPRQPVTPTPYAIRSSNAALLNGQAASAFAPAAGSAQYVSKTGDTMTGQLNLPADGLQVGNAQFAISGGNVGIGTTSPEAALHVAGGSANILLRRGDGSRTPSVSAPNGSKRTQKLDPGLTNGAASPAGDSARPLIKTRHLGVSASVSQICEVISKQISGVSFPRECGPFVPRAALFLGNSIGFSSLSLRRSSIIHSLEQHTLAKQRRRIESCKNVAG